MKLNKRNPLSELKNLYGLFNTPDYDRFVVNGGAAEMMKRNWLRVGQNLTIASSKIIQDK